ncbi:MAG: phosphotransferase enzyme family protein [Christensenellales bacterium]|jgi:Ser/Thr protein kinase RdoA (MazF antagonist)
MLENAWAAHALCALGLEGTPRRMAARSAVWRTEEVLIKAHEPVPWCEEADLAALCSEMQLMEYLAEQGIQVPLPVAPPIQVDGVCCSAVRFLKGAHPPLNFPGAAGAAGVMLEQVHRALAAYAPPGGFVRPRWDRAHFERGMTRLEQAAQQDRVDPGDLKAVARTLERALRTLEGAPLQLIHGDATVANILLTERGPALIDWSMTGWGFAAYDVGCVLAGITNPEAAEALLEAYGAMDRYQASCGMALARLGSYMLFCLQPEGGWVREGLHLFCHDWARGLQKGRPIGPLRN